MSANHSKDIIKFCCHYSTLLDRIQSIQDKLTKPNNLLVKTQARNYTKVFQKTCAQHLSIAGTHVPESLNIQHLLIYVIFLKKWVKKLGNLNQLAAAKVTRHFKEVPPYFSHTAPAKKFSIFTLGLKHWQIYVPKTVGLGYLKGLAPKQIILQMNFVENCERISIPRLKI